MNKPIGMGQTLTLLTAVLAAMAVCWVAGCVKKSGREAVPETRDTLPEIPNTLTDTRDGYTYKTVNIGKQTWMAENLNYATSRGSWCYGNKPDSCNKYGRLYTWAAAMNIRSSYNSSKWSGSDEKYLGVCPTGWHLPSNAEWTALVDAVGGSAGKKLKAKWGWNDYNGSSGNGTDDFDFSALPGGYHYHYSDGSFSSAGNYGVWWTATEYGAGDAYNRNMNYDGGRVYYGYDIKEGGFSVRCVRDLSATGASSQKSVGDDMVKVEMVFVKGGTFMMGCTNEQGSDCDYNEKPTHSVTVGDFCIGKYEVTQNQWIQVMGGDTSPSDFNGENLPVEMVSWNDVQEFILRLNTMTGKKYRLPTEAEWEYAARGGASSKGYKYSGSNNANDVAWSSVNSGDTVFSDSLLKRYIIKMDYVGLDKILDSHKSRTRAVGTKAPNELGIYDMSGNVWELVNDYWHEKYSSAAQTDPSGPSSGYSHVRRGGDWRSNAWRYCRVSSRIHDGPGYRRYGLGFRLALSP